MAESRAVAITDVVAASRVMTESRVVAKRQAA